MYLEGVGGRNSMNAKGRLECVHDFHFKLKDVSFFMGSEHLINSADTNWDRLAEGIFIFLYNNMYRAREFFQLPHDHVVEVGGQIEI
jgi:K+ transporter